MTTRRSIRADVINRAERELTALRARGPAQGWPAGIIDPPWRFETYSARGQGRSPDAHYQTMTMGECLALAPIMGSLFAPDAAVILWVTWPHMLSWGPVIEALGFAYSGLAWTWIKVNPETGKYAFGGGYGTRKNLEPCLLLTRGRPPFRTGPGARSVRDFIEAMPAVIRAARREHSRKPDEQYDNLERLVDGPYLSLFDRAARRFEGWTTWGDQDGHFAGAA